MEATVSAKENRSFNEVLEHVKKMRAIDFGAYRAGTIIRRLALRLSATGLKDYASYLEYIRKNPEEVDALIDALTIKVSRFFRNLLVFEALRESILPELLDSFRDGTLRVWCAGCAKGEEAYSIAILLREISEKERILPGIFIIGTDIDRKALEEAKRAVYKAESVQEVKKGYLDKYFTFEKDTYRLKEEIRSMVTFAYHDVTTMTSPKEGIFSEYHLLLCRNVLIYFGRHIYEKVLKGFTGFIPDRGCLVLGEAETLPTELMKEYEEVMPKVKVFRKI